MSYARFSDSDIYMFASVYGGFDCMSCRIAHGPADYYVLEDYDHFLLGPCKRGDRQLFNPTFHTGDAREMLEHLRRHVWSGDDVSNAIDRLAKEIDAGEWDDVAETKP